MAPLTENQQRKLELLEMSMGISGDSGEFLSGGPSPALCASLKREEALQYHFMVIYQTVVLVLALLVLTLLALAAWRIAIGYAFEGIIAGAGALVSGVAAGFLMQQRTDARDTYRAARAGLEKYACR